MCDTLEACINDMQELLSENMFKEVATLRTLLIAATNFSVLVAYWIWLVLILSEK